MSVAVVTGASMGIGEAVARRLLTDGWSVVGVDRLADGLADVLAAAGPERTRRVVGDVRDRDVHRQARAAAIELGGLDAWVNVAGVTVTHRLDHLDEESVREVVEINQLGSLWGAAEAVAHFVATTTPGVVVSISSVHGRRAAQHYPVYEMTKAAVDALTRSIAISYGPKGVRAVAIAPGAIMTPALRTSLETDPDRAATGRVLERASALGRIGRPEDVAAAVAFALSAEASFVTGTTICVDGGWTAALLTDIGDPDDQAAP